MATFHLKAPYVPAGDQPAAIAALSRGLVEGRRCQTLLGVTGSGKTFTMANVIAAHGRPALVISHNKTLAAQLYGEFQSFFPDNAVHYFVSYYDYYQPEAYIPQKDLYIEKDAAVNQDLDRLRLAATSALMHRDDVIIVASVSCIYGLGTPDEYARMILPLAVGATADRQAMLLRLVELQYARNDVDFKRGTFRPRGDVVEVIPAYEETGVRIRMDRDRIEALEEIHPVTGQVLRPLKDIVIYPAKHFVMSEERLGPALESIEKELEERIAELKGLGHLLEAQRLESRVRYDLEMLRETGHCTGIENYSRHLTARAPGTRPSCLIDYFPKDFLLVVDESHVTVPQIGGMSHGDRSRKETLVTHGFRLPSALDNRPMRFEEWEASFPQAVFVSATPAPYELKKSGGEVVEQILRPTGLLDPTIEVRPTTEQIPDLMKEVQVRVGKKERVLVTALTKRMAEDLSEYLKEAGIKVHYLHSDQDAFERVQVLKDLRGGTFDAVVGVNLLREGLDLPEVSLVAILDADKEGFLRSETSLIQTIGRTARNVNAHVILYGDKVTPAMGKAMSETARRRQAQLEYNQAHGITPQTVKKALRETIEADRNYRKTAEEVAEKGGGDYAVEETVFQLEGEMLEAAKGLDFEKAAALRNRILKLKPGWKGLESAPALAATRKKAKGKGRKIPR